jgi:hypothetical protein
MSSWIFSFAVNYKGAVIITETESKRDVPFAFSVLRKSEEKAWQ